LVNPDKKQKHVMIRFGNKLKPYLEALLNMEKKQISFSTLKRLQNDMITIGRLHLTNESCPLMYPITDFFVCYLEEGLKEFVEQNQSI
jgi:hypothetical protein